MDKKTKEVVDFMVDRIKTQKTMFIPGVAISAFALVGYAAADRTAPIVHSNKLEVPFGTELKASDFTVSDNRDTVSVIVSSTVVANAGSDQGICASTTATLAGNAATPGTGAWSSLGTALVTTSSSPIS